MPGLLEHHLKMPRVPLTGPLKRTFLNIISHDERDQSPLALRFLICQLFQIVWYRQREIKYVQADKFFNIPSDCGSIERDLPVTVEIELGERIMAEASLPSIQIPETAVESVIRTMNALQLDLL